MFRRTFLRISSALLVVAAGVVASSAVASGARAVPRQPALAPCANASIDAWLDTSGNGAAGSVYYQLRFTNTSRQACSLRGYPGVSAVTRAGRQLGAAARRDPTTAVRTTDIAPGASATATWRVVDTGDFSTAACRPATAFGLRVYAPNQTASDVIPFPFSVCSRAATISISIQPVRS